MPHIVRLIRHVLIEEDFTSQYAEIESIVKQDMYICMNLIDRYEKNEHPFNSLNLNELKDLITNVKASSDPKWYNGDLSKLIKDPRQSVKAQSVVTDEQEQEIVKKVQAILNEDAELKRWYDCALSFCKHFEEERDSGRGHLVPKSYQMYVAADLCKQIAGG